MVGMHRSGTSAISGLLDRLGIFMGKHLYGPQKGVNEKGFFENAKIVEFNDVLFDAKVQAWDDPYAIEQSESIDPVYASYENVASDLLRSEYQGHDLWGMKDPRTSLHLAFWHNIFSNNAITPHYLLMLRNPMEVAMSLEKRDGFLIEHSLRLWINYTLSSILTIRSAKHIVVDFNQLIANPEQVLADITKAFDLSGSAGASDFIEKSLRHNSSLVESDTEIGKIATALYQTLLQDVIDFQQVTNIAAQYSAIIEHENVLMRAHCHRLKQEEIYYRQCFLEAYESVWWKITWPLRALEKRLRKNKP
ncbi:sulfotransferase family protein [Thalassotalea agarivorans]|uniref:sulfotransferase family protein n=1 Tax=Thalassotalea agarivorans TaxID=349064 RepID=UPI002481CCEA|nr:sulfotransferase [Thalassotalea agarivorans]